MSWIILITIHCITSFCMKCVIMLWKHRPELTMGLGPLRFSRSNDIGVLGLHSGQHQDMTKDGLNHSHIKMRLLISHCKADPFEKVGNMNVLLKKIEVSLMLQEWRMEWSQKKINKKVFIITLFTQSKHVSQLCKPYFFFFIWSFF